MHCLRKRLKQVCTTSVNIANKVCTFFRQSHLTIRRLTYMNPTMKAKFDEARDNYEEVK